MPLAKNTRYHLQSDIISEIIEDRYGSGATVLTNQCPVKEWHQAIGDPTLADAICDRLFHNAYKFELRGESIRKARKKGS